MQLKIFNNDIYSGRAQVMSRDVFISYSREDKDFVRKLLEALQVQGREAWVDWQDIEYSTRWWDEICEGIERANNFVLVMSPDSLDSEYCHREIEHARKCQKRIITFIYREIDPQNIVGGWYKKPFENIARMNWEYLQSIQYISLPLLGDLSKAVNALIATSDKDLEYIRYHTELHLTARAWEQNGRSPGFLLRYERLAQAEAWMANTRGIEPQPTELQHEFVQASRIDENERQLDELRAKDAQLVLEKTNRDVKALRLAQRALQLNERNQVDAIALALAANQIAMPKPPPFAQEILAHVAYAPGPRRVFREQAGGVNSAVFSPDGKLIVSGSGDGMLRLWDVSTGEMLNVASPNWQKILSTDDMLSFFQSAVQQRHGMVEFDGSVTSLDFSADGQHILSGYHNGRLLLLDGKLEKGLQIYKGHDFKVTAVAFSPNGQHVLSGSWDGTLRLWDMASGETLQLFEGHDSKITSAAFNRDGTQIVSVDLRGTVYVWDAATGGHLRVLHEDKNVTSTALSPDGQVLLSGFDEGKIHWRSTHTGNVLQVFNGRKTVKSLAVGRNGNYVLSGYDDGTLELWDLATTRIACVFSGHERLVNNMTFCPDNIHVLSGSSDGTLRLWDSKGRECLAVFYGHEYAVNQAVFSPNGQRVICASMLGGSNFLICQDGNHIVTDTIEAWLYWLDTTPNETWHRLREKNTLIEPEPLGEGEMRARKRDPLPLLYLWNIATGECVRSFKGHQGEIRCLALSLDEKKLLSGSSNGSLCLWDTSTGKILQVLAGHEKAVSAVAFSPDGKYILSGSRDATLRLWDAVKGQILRDFDGHEQAVSAVAFSPDGKCILSGSDDKTVRLWDTLTGEAQYILNGHEKAVNSVAFSPDGNSVLSGAQDGTLRSWDVLTGEILRVFNGHKRVVNNVVFSPDGNKILSSSEDGTIRLWRNDTAADLISWVYANREVRLLTEIEIRQFGLERIDVSSK